MDGGSRELARSAGAYLACVAFAISFLVATFTGGSLATALMRSSLVAVVTLFVARLLMRMALSTILDAIARDQAAEQTGEAK